MKISEVIGLTCEVALLGFFVYGAYQVYKEDKEAKETEAGVENAKTKSSNLPEGAVGEDENKIYFDAEHKYWRPKENPVHDDEKLVMPSYWK